jgi:dipeptidyl aminopeptidase/acylaminoacyl peptidase
MGTGATRVSFKAHDGSEVVGTWYRGPADNAPGILLLHGNGSSRGQFARLAPWFNAQGYAVLAIDFRGHGESAQVSKSFGWYEARDAHAAYAWFKSRQRGAKIGIVGTSLGGAASLIGEDGPVPADALVLLAVYPDIRRAIYNRIASRTGPITASIAEPLLSYQSGPRFGVWPGAISPHDALKRYRGPVFVIGGAADTSTPPDETTSMAKAAPHLERLWIVPGQTHEHLTGGNDAAYRQALLGFFEKYLKTGWFERSW